MSTPYSYILGRRLGLYLHTTFAILHSLNTEWLTLQGVYGFKLCRSKSPSRFSFCLFACLWPCLSSRRYPIWKNNVITTPRSPLIVAFHVPTPPGPHGGKRKERWEKTSMPAREALFVFCTPAAAGERSVL